jgi:hypothetical protein
MKKLYALMSAVATLGVVLSTPAVATDIALPITETEIGGGPETLSVGFAGAIIGGTTDNWTITLPGFALSNFFGSVAWAEKPGDSGFNVLSVIGSDELGLVSESASCTKARLFSSTTIRLPSWVDAAIGHAPFPDSSELTARST